jgi:NADH:ubiquinone oxidoreductase subunit K
MAAAALLLLVGFGIQGLATAQNALRSYRVNTVVPCLVAAQLLVPIAMAQAVYGQDVRVASRGALALAAFAIAVGLALLCTSQRATSSIALHREESP